MKLNWKEIYSIATIARNDIMQHGEEWEKEQILPICNKLIEISVADHNNFELKGI